MTKENHFTANLINRVAIWQKNLRKLTSLIPTRKLPLLTEPEAFGPGIERFRDPNQALVSWRDKQAQTWTLRAILKNAQGRIFSTQLHFFDRHTQNDFVSIIPARWILPKLFAAHFSITDAMNADTQRAYRTWQKGGLIEALTAKSNTRGTTGFANTESFHVELDGWQTFARKDGSFNVFAAQGSDSVHIECTPTKKMTYHGQSGFTENAYSCGYTSMKAQGRILSGGQLEIVQGTVWFDHEKFSSSPVLFQPIEDRICLQFDDGELLISRRPEVTFAEWISADGEIKHIIASEIDLQTLEYWTSPRTQARYPSKLRIQIKILNLECDIRPAVVHQELDATRTTLQPYWSGLILSKGTKQNQNFETMGFAEYVGYDQRPRTKLFEFLTKAN